jgi:serine/threonine protein kinase
VGLVFRHPEPGEMVGDYRIVKELGSGGFGTVFKAERGGLFFAVKMFRSSELGARERREISILLQVEHPGVVRFRACDRWLDPKIGTPYIVTDFVPGMTLEEYAEVENPSARRSARIILESGLTLGEVHLQGVFHRDLKPENIIIKDKNERPVLIDFGVGSYVGAPVITPHGLPPGTYEYRSPEAYLFNRANTELAHYEFSAADELWALGVIFYWLLTNVLPFGDRNDPEGGGLAKRILQQRPVAPHVLNPRVPRALSDICMKMLEKEPAARYASVVELCAALGDAMADAELDGRWDLPLFDPDAPDTRTTEEDPAMVDANEDEETRMMRKWARARPRRGRKPKKEAEPAPEVIEKAGAAPAPVAEVLAAVPEQKAPAVAVAPVPELVPLEPVPPPAEAPRATAAPHPPVARHRARLAAAAGVAAVVLGVALVVKRVEPTSEPPPVFVREVALAPKPLESLPGEDAAPVGAQLPASTANAMLRTPAQTPKNETPKPQTQSSGFRLPVKPAVAAAAACSLLDGGCTASTPQVRPGPPAITCPEGWRETHERFSVGYAGIATVKGYRGEPGEVVRVKDGPVTLQVGVVGAVGVLPDGALLLGAWQLGDDRLFGTFTRAQIPGVGTLPVCLVAGLYHEAPYLDEHGKEYLCPPGLGVCLTPESKPGNAKTATRVLLLTPTGQP